MQRSVWNDTVPAPVEPAQPARRRTNWNLTVFCSVWTVGICRCKEQWASERLHPRTAPLRHDRDVDDLIDGLQLRNLDMFLYCLKHWHLSMQRERTCERPYPRTAHVEPPRLPAQFAPRVLVSVAQLTVHRTVDGLKLRYLNSLFCKAWTASLCLQRHAQHLYAAPGRLRFSFTLGEVWSQ